MTATVTIGSLGLELRLPRLPRGEPKLLALTFLESLESALDRALPELDDLVVLPGMRLEICCTEADEEGWIGAAAAGVASHIAEALNGSTVTRAAAATDAAAAPVKSAGTRGNVAGDSEAQPLVGAVVGTEAPERVGFEFRELRPDETPPQAGHESRWERATRSPTSLDTRARPGPSAEPPGREVIELGAEARVRGSERTQGEKRSAHAGPAEDRSSRPAGGVVPGAPLLASSDSRAALGALPAGVRHTDPLARRFPAPELPELDASSSFAWLHSRAAGLGFLLRPLEDLGLSAALAAIRPASPLAVHWILRRALVRFAPALAEDAAAWRIAGLAAPRSHEARKRDLALWSPAEVESLARAAGVETRDPIAAFDSWAQAAARELAGSLDRGDDADARLAALVRTPGTLLDVPDALEIHMAFPEVYAELLRGGWLRELEHAAWLGGRAIRFVFKA